MLRLALASALSLACVTVTHAFDKEEYQNADPKIREWFRSVRSPRGVPCCDIADGHQTTWQASKLPGYEYEVPIDGEWIPVPPEAVVRNAGNPTGESIVWYVRLRSDEKSYQIRCFVLGGGV